jgi:hypothetical protein
MSPQDKEHSLSRLGAFAVVFYSILFGWEIVAPYFIGKGVQIGDANTKAVLTNIVIAIVAYLFGRNEGSRQADQTISKLVDTAKTVAQATIAASPNPDVTVSPGETVTVKADDAPAPTP